MKESLLRETIRKEIRKSLKEQDVTGRAETGISRLEKQPGIKMLKTALSSGTPKQQAAGLLKVINLVSGGSRAVKSQLVQMLQQGGLEAEEPSAEAPVAEADVNPALARKADRVDKTQAMKMLKQAVSSKGASQQSDFVLDLVNNLGLKDSAKQRIKMQIRKALK